MKAKSARKLMAIFFTICMMMSFMPISVFGEGAATETADFTAADGGAAALTLLNESKTGSEDSTWDSASKTLTLKGINFTTSATTALKLPDGATVVLADGTENQIKGGDATVETTGKQNTKICICGIDAQGALNIKGESNGTGKLSVTSGMHNNTGDAWTYSVGILASGNLNIQGGTVTTTAGKASCGDCAFSYGIQMKEGNSLSVTGGTLNAIGGESVDTGSEDVRKSFSGGIETYRGDVSISGNAKLNTKCVSAMDGEGLAYGIYALVGSVNVSDNAELYADATKTIYISNGNLKQTGGKITAVHKGNTGYSLDVELSTLGNVNNLGSVGNIEVSGGTLETVDGNVSMSSYNAKDTQSNFVVTGGTVKINSVYGANKFSVSGGEVHTQKIDSKAFSLTNGKLTIREPVHKYNDNLYTGSAISCRDITVSSGTLDVAWDWGNYTPVVFPNDEYKGYPTPLVEFSDGTAVFNGGTSKFNTGCAGNFVFKRGTVTAGSGMVEIGADAEQKQKNSDIPVTFTAGSAIGEVEIDKATIDSYKTGDAPEATAVSCDKNSKNYYFYECWEEIKETDNGLEPVAYWYSDGDYMAFVPDNQKITSFEEGKKYLYSVRATAKGDFVFANEGVLKAKLNGEDLSGSNSILVSADGKDLQITSKTITIQTPDEYKVIEGANSSWTQNSEGTLTFRADGDFSKFLGIKVDDSWVDSENYISDSGSTIVTLKNEYLQTLAAGTHKMTFVYTDGECNTNFEIKEAKEAEEIYENSDNPTTGDSSNILLWVSLFSAGVLVAIVIAVCNRKKKSTF